MVALTVTVSGGRAEREALELAVLAPYAAKSANSGGRHYSEHEHDYRTPYQRDRERIIHSRAFRRLEYKTQVFVNHEGDYYRTRLTHSLEVAQIARTVARALRLNEDLAEAVALSHDLGHTPFGHAGESAMHALMQAHGGFEHNRQSFRVVTVLEDSYPRFPGLNLTVEVLQGLTKKGGVYSFADGAPFPQSGVHTLEAELADVADEIAYNNHDIDDGLKSGMLSLDDLAAVPLWTAHFSRVAEEMSAASLRVKILQTVKDVINTLVTDLLEQTLKNIESQGLHSLEAVREKGPGAVRMSEAMRKENALLKRTLFAKLYHHYRVERMAVKAGRVVRELFGAYCENPRILPPQFFSRVEAEGKERAVCDYIAGMTDRFALQEYKKLFDPFERV